MAKGYKRNHYNKSKTIYLPPASDINDDVAVGSTHIPNEHPPAINNYWMSNSTTTLHEDEDEDEDEHENYARSWSSLTDKGLQGKIQIPPRSAFLFTVIAWAIVCSWLFLADNQVGRLDSVDGIRWFLNKALLLTSFYIIVSIILVLFTVAIRRLYKPKEKAK